jgi:hypothetical protein
MESHKEKNGGRTGWPPGLLQDDSKELSRWFASRPDARYQLRRVLAEIKPPERKPHNEKR